MTSKLAIYIIPPNGWAMGGYEGGGVVGGAGPNGGHHWASRTRAPTSAQSGTWTKIDTQPFSGQGRFRCAKVILFRWWNVRKPFRAQNVKHQGVKNIFGSSNFEMLKTCTFEGKYTEEPFGAKKVLHKESVCSNTLYGFRDPKCDKSVCNMRQNRSPAFSGQADLIIVPSTLFLALKCLLPVSPLKQCFLPINNFRAKQPTFSGYGA